MRTKFKFLIAAAAVAVGFTSCTNDDDVNPGVQGEKAGLRISIPSVKTYADENAILAESEFKSATIFVYNGVVLEKEQTFGAADFTLVPATSQYEMNDPMEVMSGVKKIYVGLNLTSADITAVKNGLHSPYSVNSSDITKSETGFAMFSANDSVNNNFTVEVGAANKFTIKVERWVAKVTSRVSADVNTEASGAEIKDFSFAMGQVNKKMFPFQKLLVSGVIEDPNWSGFDMENGIYGPSDFVNEFGTNDAINTSAYVAVDADNVGVADRKVKYVLENTSESVYQGEVTYASVRAKFTPKAYHTYNATDGLVETAAKPNVPSTLYVVQTNTGTYYFEENADAVAFAKSMGLDTDVKGVVGEYKNGFCYYFVFLDSKKSNSDYTVLRNNYYDTRITKINSLGYPNPEVPNPEIPLAKYTEIDVIIEMLPWELVSSDVELGPI